MKMNTTLRQSVQLVLAASTVLAGTAHAILPAAFTSGERTSNVLRFSGATATDATLQALARENSTSGLCSSTGGIDYFTSGANSGGTQTAILCNGANALAGNRIALIKESEAGSANGSVYVGTATPTNLDFLDVFNASFACGGDDNNTATNDAGTITFDGSGVPQFNNPKSLTGSGLLAANQYTNCTPQAQFAATAGISDVEAPLLAASLGLVYGNKATGTPQFQIVFGVPVSLNLYRALQIAQGVTTQAACDTPAEQDTPSCAPSLDRSTIAALYSGSLSDWSQIVRRDNGTNDPITGIDIAGPATAPTDTTVYICRRGNSSGSQATAAAYFMNQGCKSSVKIGSPDTPATETNGVPYTSAYANAVVFAGDGSGDVRDCLDDRNNQNRWAIGVLSTESAVDGTFTLKASPSSTINTTGNIGGDGGLPVDTDASGDKEGRTREFRFVRVNGFLPSLEVAANGGYDYFSENVCYLRTGGVVTGVALSTYNAICGANGLSKLNSIKTINLSFDNQPWGNGGNLGIPFAGSNLPNAASATSYITQAQMAANPVGSTTRSPGGVPNTCSPVVNVNTSIAQPSPVGPTP